MVAWGPRRTRRVRLGCWVCTMHAEMICSLAFLLSSPLHGGRNWIDISGRRFGRLLFCIYRSLVPPSLCALTPISAGLTRALAGEMGPLGVRVNVIMPGYVETDMTAGKSAEEEKTAQCLYSCEGKSSFFSYVLQDEVGHCDFRGSIELSCPFPGMQRLWNNRLPSDDR